MSEMFGGYGHFLGGGLDPKAPLIWAYVPMFCKYL